MEEQGSHEHSPMKFREPWNCLFFLSLHHWKKRNVSPPPSSPPKFFYLGREKINWTQIMTRYHLLLFDLTTFFLFTFPAFKKLKRGKLEVDCQSLLIYLVSQSPSIDWAPTVCQALCWMLEIELSLIGIEGKRRALGTSNWFPVSLESLLLLEKPVYKHDISVLLICYVQWFSFGKKWL